jgi:hypothetical protein
MKKLFRRSTAIAAMVVAVALAGGTGLHAQSAASVDKQREVAERLQIKFFAADAFTCRGEPGWQAAMEQTSAELTLIDNTIADLRGGKNTFGGYHYADSDLSADQRAQISTLYRIRQRLHDIFNALWRLPPCDKGYRTVFANGVFLGIYLVKATGGTVITERFIASDRITNQFADSHDPVGVGANLAYAFAPWNNNIVVSPFVSFDYLNNSVNHGFPGGSFLGSTANVSGTAGVKIGPSISRDFWLYGIAGVSVLNETLNVNFLPVTSSTSKNVAGATLGAGFAFRPGFLQNLGRPVSLFAEYHHTWWQDAQFNSPVASPLFNYNFRRADDVVKLGFNVHFEEPPPAPLSMPVKAPAPR